jgi:hypothetical protein
MLGLLTFFLLQASQSPSLASLHPSNRGCHQDLLLLDWLGGDVLQLEAFCTSLVQGSITAVRRELDFMAGKLVDVVLMLASPSSRPHRSSAAAAGSTRGSLSPRGPGKSDQLTALRPALERHVAERLYTVALPPFRSFGRATGMDERELLQLLQGLLEDCVLKSLIAVNDDPDAAAAWGKKRRGRGPAVKSRKRVQPAGSFGAADDGSASQQQLQQQLVALEKELPALVLRMSYAASSRLRDVVERCLMALEDALGRGPAVHPFIANRKRKVQRKDYLSKVFMECCG